MPFERGSKIILIGQISHKQFLIFSDTFLKAREQIYKSEQCKDLICKYEEIIVGSENYMQQSYGTDK